MERSKTLAAVFAIVLALSVSAQAQVTPQIASQLRDLGPSVCVPETAKIYKPLLLDKPPYKGVTIVRDIQYIDDPRTVMDLFAPEKGGGNRPVLLYIPGGNGDKLHPPPDGDAFYDNVMMWAVKNGMVGVNMQRRGGLGGGGRGTPPAQPDQATLLARSNLQGLANGKTAVFLGWGEVDPSNILTFDEALKNALCKAGHCATSVFFKDHSHMSLVFSPNTPDTSVTAPILKWMKSIK